MCDACAGSSLVLLCALLPHSSSQHMAVSGPCLYGLAVIAGSFWLGNLPLVVWEWQLSKLFVLAGNTCNDDDDDDDVLQSLVTEGSIVCVSVVVLLQRMRF